MSCVVHRWHGDWDAFAEFHAALPSSSSVGSPPKVGLTRNTKKHTYQKCQRLWNEWKPLSRRWEKKKPLVFLWTKVGAGHDEDDHPEVQCVGEHRREEEVR